MGKINMFANEGVLQNAEERLGDWEKDSLVKTVVSILCDKPSVPDSLWRLDRAACRAGKAERPVLGESIFFWKRWIEWFALPSCTKFWADFSDVKETDMIYTDLAWTSHEIAHEEILRALLCAWFFWRQSGTFKRKGETRLLGLSSLSSLVHVFLKFCRFVLFCCAF